MILFVTWLSFLWDLGSSNLCSCWVSSLQKDSTTCLSLQNIAILQYLCTTKQKGFMFIHTTPFLTKGFEKSLCNFVGTTFALCENPPRCLRGCSPHTIVVLQGVLTCFAFPGTDIGAVLKRRVQEGSIVQPGDTSTQKTRWQLPLRHQSGNISRCCWTERGLWGSNLQSGFQSVLWPIK